MVWPMIFYYGMITLPNSSVLETLDEVIIDAYICSFSPSSSTRTVQKVKVMFSFSQIPYYVSYRQFGYIFLAETLQNLF